MASRLQNFPAFPDSWDRLASAPSMLKQGTQLASLEGTEKLGLMAYRNGVLYETMFPEPVATELRLLSSTLLQISGLQALGRSLASLVVALRQLWLS
ncbi:UNVERIFIED_CONTAM: hypothetical protein FKN15_067732 [Acipenser sinensis]